MDELLANFGATLKALTASRPGERVAPGVIFSWLPDAGVFYTSIHVWKDNKRGVICQGKGATLDEALNQTFAAYEVMP